MLATFFGLNIVFEVKPQVWMNCGILFLFYGLYFGVLGRDVAEICADKMASHIGVRIKKDITIGYYICSVKGMNGAIYWIIYSIMYQVKCLQGL